MRPQRLKAPTSARDDRIRIGPPDKGPCFSRVVLGDETIDRGLQVDDGMKDTVSQPSPCELGEEAFNSIQPGT